MNDDPHPEKENSSDSYSRFSVSQAVKLVFIAFVFAVAVYTFVINNQQAVQTILAKTVTNSTALDANQCDPDAWEACTRNCMSVCTCNNGVPYCPYPFPQKTETPTVPPTAPPTAPPTQTPTAVPTQIYTPPPAVKKQATPKVTPPTYTYKPVQPVVTSTPAPTACITPPPPPQGMACGSWGCADDGRTGEAADKACQGWGPDTPNTKYECKEGRVDPVSGKKGQCAVVTKNFCPGQDADPDNACGCVPAGAVKCGPVDVDNNNLLNQVDLKAFADVMGKTCTDSKVYYPGCGNKDYNHDSKIDYTDLLYFVVRYSSVAGSCDKNVDP